jgi:endonuclease/exonuclease/phosphatase (EEP) superfamily protein YafD
VVWLLIRFASDRWWPATVLLYGPRWVWAVPAVVLAPFALRFRRRALWALAGAVALTLGPIMGLCLPSPARGAARGDVLSLNVLSCNVEGSYGDSAALFKLIEESRSDIVALQEGPSSAALPAAMVQLGWHVRQDGGLFLASRFPIVSADRIPSEDGWRSIGVCYELRAPSGELHFINLHLDTPRHGLESVRYRAPQMVAEMYENTARRWRESRAAAARAAELLHDGAPLLIAGDFNTPVESAIYRSNWANYADAYGVAGFGYGYTKWTRFWGARIDHILAGPGWHVQECAVGPSVSSDHRPLIAKLAWAGTR